ncbi:MAG: hypothetical protein AAF492_19435, partial [Verrucomicrobiota bacterium]
MTDKDETMGERAAAPFGRVDVAALLILALLSAFLFMRGMGSYGLWDPWEPKYAIAVDEMIERGDLVTPFLFGKRRWTKPIGIYWAMFVSQKILGFRDFGARFPSALAAVMAVLFTYFFLR